MNKFISCALLYLFVSCHSIYGTKDVLEGKYKMVQENHLQLANTNFSVFKEYKNGKFIDYKVTKGNRKKLTRFSGDYFIVNDSIYVEYLDADNMSNNQLTHKAYAFKYTLKNDTLTQQGEVYINLKNSKKFYYGSKFKTYYIKVSE